uniref:Pif-3 n=1 Tax=Spodoptera frugiperda granulovirus TaxID=307454 RepID=A0A346QVU6_9BBAC|nr:pif-3 [Spodoptera frugiperda granulovirus]
MPWMVLLTVLAMVVGIGLYLWNNVERAEPPATLVQLLYARDDVPDCTTKPLPCVTNKQCEDNCQNGLFMVCEQGFCKKYLKPVEYVGVEDCDIRRGMVMVMYAIDAFLVERFCISLYRDVIDDKSELRPYVCEPGNMRIDLETGPFDVSDCTCAAGYRKFAYHQGAYARSTPVCIPNRLTSLYDRVYDGNIT